MEIITPKRTKEWEDAHGPTKGTLEWFEKNKDHLDFADQEKARFMKDVFDLKKEVLKIHGAYGPEEDGPSNAYIDEVIFPETGGTFTKIYGCPFKIKGLSPGNVVYGLQLSKHLFSDFPRSISRNSWILTLALGLAWLFNRRGFIQIMIDLAHTIDHKVVKHLTYSPVNKGPWPQKWYNQCEKEIERALLEASKGEKLWDKFFIMFTPFFKLFLYVDNTYRNRVQDALPEGNSLLEVIKVLRKREKGIWKTWLFLEWAIWFALLTSPALKRIEKRFFKTLDKSKIVMDEDDRYFALTYKSYDFGSVPYEQRVAERERLNRENHVVYL